MVSFEFVQYMQNDGGILHLDYLLKKYPRFLSVHLSSAVSLIDPYHLLVT